MKKRMILAAVMISLGTLVFANAPAASDTAVINLSGVIEPKVVITADVEDVELNLMADAGDIVIATLTEWSNVRAGYEVSLGSTGNGRLVNTADDSEFLPYTVSYGGVTRDLSNGAVVVTDSESKSVGQGTDKALGISFTANGDLGDGLYTDSLTFTITAK